MCTLLRKDNPSHILKRSPTNLVGLFLYLPKKMIRHILAVITGVLVGMIVNMGLFILGSSLIPITEGFDHMNAINWDQIILFFLF